MPDKITPITKDSCPTNAELNEILAGVHYWANKEYGEPIGSGLYRIVYDAGDEVCKIPKSFYTIGMNYSEEYKYQRYQKEGILAKCYIIHKNDFPLLYMEKVILATDFKNLPDWVGGIDCMQVGYTKEGVLVAYDYH
jgi:hypothetical protein